MPFPPLDGVVVVVLSLASASPFLFAPLLACYGAREAGERIQAGILVPRGRGVLVWIGFFGMMEESSRTTGKRLLGRVRGGMMMVIMIDWDHLVIFSGEEGEGIRYRWFRI
jgi:hypothetical protein